MADANPGGSGPSLPTDTSSPLQVLSACAAAPLAHQRPLQLPLTAPTEYVARGGQGAIFNGLWQGSPVAVKVLGKASSKSALAELRAVSPLRL